MPSIYRTSGIRLWNVDTRVELATSASAGDIQLVKFLLRRVSRWLEEQGRLGFYFPQDDLPVFTGADRDAAMLYQEHYRGHSITPLTPDGIVSKMRYGGIEYGNGKIWTLARLQVDYCNLSNDRDPDHLPQPAEVGHSTILMINDPEMPGGLRSALVVALAK